MKVNSDVLIIGSGISGILVALKIAKNSDLNISLITKENLHESNTRYAQGGIAAVIANSDTFESHIKDTLKAGAGLCKEDVVRQIISHGPSIIRELEDIGVKFDKDDNNEIELGREGGHSVRRVAHVADTTGLAIQNQLVQKLKNNKQITYYENHIAIDLVTISGQIAGVYTLDKETNSVRNFAAKITIIATGGAGKAFLYTSNPDICSGDGIAMAYRAGATIANMEFIQFHPTLYYNPDFHSFLISEALRGEGAVLRNIGGDRIMKDIHPLEDLAPRDIVARAIDAELKKSGDDYVLLDITSKSEDYLKNRFPNIYQTLLQYNLNICEKAIPVVPAAHYTIGGIKTWINGKTDLKGLYALGEATNTGLHGANRLASNSLLEGAVMASLCAKSVINEIKEDAVKLYSFPPWESGDVVDSDEQIVVTHNWDELRRTMNAYVGIVRTTKRLLRAEKRINVLKDEVARYYWDFKVNSDIIELRNLVQVSDLIVKSALFRRESRGAHYTTTFPENSDEIRETLIQKTLGIYHSEKLN